MVYLLLRFHFLPISNASPDWFLPAVNLPRPNTGCGRFVVAKQREATMENVFWTDLREDSRSSAGSCNSYRGVSRGVRYLGETDRDKPDSIADRRQERERHCL
ncbi:hypothetical protein TGMAS_237835 [Toxoplasma gondii MAS]|uniref:Secreted protein n=1 Tax=Toxoplasma gondii MAS TaxID=943118 RepID=A0A086PL13_TOXGO|nr:hypothetical protein TGMAS_237835 [Toxoplasma gondii MAS]